MPGSHTESGSGSSKSPNRSPLKALLSQTAIYGLSTVVVRLLNYILVPVHTNFFDNQAAYGIISELYAYVTFLNILFLYGMETAFFRFATKDEKPEKVFGTAFFSLLLSTSLFTSTIIFAAGGIEQALELGGRKEFVIWFALIIALDTLAAIPFAWLRHASRPMLYMAVKLLNVVVNVGLNIWFLFGPGYHPEINVGYVFLANLAASAITLLVLLPFILKIKPRFDKLLWRKMFAYGAPFILAGLAGMVNETIDRILLPRLLPGTIMENRAQLGIYGAVYKLSIFMTLAVQAFRLGAEPFFFRMAGEADAKDIYAKVMRAFVPAGCLMFLVVSLSLDYFGLIIGPNYREGLFVVPILLMANLFLGIYYNLSVWYKLTDTTINAVWLALGGAVLTLILNYTLIPVMGYEGAAWTTLVAYVLMALASWVMGKRVYPVPYPVLKLLTMIAVAGLICLCFFQFEIHFSTFTAWIYRIAAWGLFFAFAWWLDLKSLIRG